MSNGDSACYFLAAAALSAADADVDEELTVIDEDCMLELEADTVGDDMPVPDGCDDMESLPKPPAKPPGFTPVFCC